jgi:hypothetical protein
MVGE